MHDLSGRVINGYELRERIGSGAFGVVYRAYQPALHRDIALKLIVPAVSGQPEFVERFDSEALTIARLEHPYIMPLFDYWRDDTGAYLAMRWLRGGSLRQALRHGALDNETVTRIVDQIGSALAAAHRRGIVHRDIKPDNILLDDDGNAYLTDFGIAIEVNSAENRETDELVGSAAYMSPEQISGDRVTIRSDIYSFGIVLFEMLTGRHPFAQEQTFDILHRQLTQPVPPLYESRPDLPDALDDVIQRATAKDPAARYPDALSFAVAVHHYLSGDADARTASARVYAKSAVLPHRARRLIGRDTLRAQVNRLLGEHERVLLHGFGGIGKTALAAAVASDQLDTRETAVLWLEAGSSQASSLLESIAHALGEGKAIIGKSRQERMGIVREILADRPLLLVLDNVWNDQALFETLQAVPETMPVLITSRHAIPIEGSLIDVGTLAPNQALELLGYYAGKRYAGSHEARALCRKLGYHTFALEIAGKNLKADQQLTPARLIARLADAPHDLRVPGSYAIVGRESVKDLLDASICELDDADRRIFMAMGGLFAPKASLELLALALNDDLSRVEQSVVTLQQRGLATLVYEHGPEHYRLHDLTYSYARAFYRTQHDTHAPAINAALRYVERYSEDHDRLDFELENILAAARVAYDCGDPDTLIQIMNTLAVSGGYFAARGHNAHSLDMLRLAIDAALEREDIRAAHFLLSKLGNTYANLMGDLERALDAYRQAARLAVLMNDRSREALLLSAIGTVRARQGATDAASYLQSAYELARAEGDDEALSQILEHLGYQAALREDYAAARAYYRESLEVAARLDSIERQFFALSNLGAAEQALGNYGAALDLNRKALAIAQSRDEQLWMGYALECIGEALHGLGDREQAQHAFDEALALFCRIGALVRAQALTRIMKAGNYSIAHDCLEKEGPADEVFA